MRDVGVCGKVVAAEVDVLVEVEVRAGEDEEVDDVAGNHPGDEEDAEGDIAELLVA